MVKKNQYSHEEEVNKNYWAVILGGSSGLGLATAQKLAKHGYNICIVHRNRKSEIENIYKEFELIKNEDVELLTFNVDAFNIDKRKEIINRLEEVLNKVSCVKVLIHSVSKGNLKPMVSKNSPVLNNDDFHLTLDAMAISLYDWTKAIFDAKLFASDTRIISYTSEGNTKAWRNYAAVSAAKTALEAITRNIALEFAPFGIKANCIQAGVTDTASLRMIPESDKIKQYSLARNPFKRLTTPQDVANIAYLLCRDEAIWINGTIIPVDGGEHLS
ncbi:MAG: SDR family oxidoreductase [Flavobacteriaceae bacterium]|nr:SDR family oxidoreductase [Flavobacteriaceae bacterium]